MRLQTPPPGPRRLIALGGIVIFCLCLCVPLALVLDWTVGDSWPPVRVEPRGYVNRLGDMEPRLKLVDREIPGLPYRVTTNAEGFRGSRPVTAERSAGTLRVLCLGDSYTYGVGVDDPFTYPSILEVFLQKRLPGRDVQVVNAGVPFYDIFDELSYFQEKGVRLKPDVVVLQFYINDLEAMAGSFFRQDLLVRQGGRYNALDQGIRREAVELWINAWMEKRFPRLFGVIRSGDAPSGPSRAATGPFGSYHLRPTDAERALLGDRQKMLSADGAATASRLWDNYRRALLVLRDAVEASGAKFLLVIAPDVAQVREDLNQPAAALVPFCRQNGIPVIDLARELRVMSGEKRERYYLLPQNPHPNAAGNTVMAQAVADALHVTGGMDRPEVAVVPTTTPFAYAQPVAVNLRFGPDGVLPARNGPIRVTPVRSVNLASWGIDIGQNRIGGLVPDATQAPVGELVLRIDADTPLDQVSVTFFRKFAPPINGQIALCWSREDRDYTMAFFASDQDVPAPEGFESGRLVEIDLREAPTRQVYLRLELRNEARIFTESLDPPWRRFEVVCYPAGDRGSGEPARPEAVSP